MTNEKRDAPQIEDWEGWTRKRAKGQAQGGWGTRSKEQGGGEQRRANASDKVERNTVCETRGNAYMFAPS